MESESPEPSLAVVLEEISGLRDLFQRRLLEDKAKGRLVDELHEQLAVARGGLSEQLLGPVFRALLLVVDRIRSLESPADNALLESIADELLEILRRQGVRAVSQVTVFDPLFHEAVRAEAGEGRIDGAILDVLRPGYVLGMQLLRPSQVVVASSRIDRSPDLAEPMVADVADHFEEGKCDE
jgi:molecular chaperone GrpE